MSVEPSGPRALRGHPLSASPYERRKLFKPKPGEESFPNTRPRDAAALIIVDFSGRNPRVLMGRRQKSAVFMPDVFVFPGGRVEPCDYCAPCASKLSPPAAAKLLKRVRGQAHPRRARALAMAALREAAEEAGATMGSAGDGGLPRLDLLAPIARAVTPPKQRRRFDTRFFAVDARDMRFSSRSDGELSRLGWFTFAEARAAPMHVVTLSVLGDLERRIDDGGWSADHFALPFYFKRGSCFGRILL